MWEDSMSLSPRTGGFILTIYTWLESVLQKLQQILNGLHCCLFIFHRSYKQLNIILHGDLILWFENVTLEETIGL